MSFELIPAIDLLDGACVRLSQGRYDAATVYERDPAAVVERFVRHRIGRIHVVDLDGAKAGRPQNRDAVLRIVERAGRVPVQLGGGIRTLRDVEDALETGVGRAILGTVALREPPLVRTFSHRALQKNRVEPSGGDDADADDADEIRDQPGGFPVEHGLSATADGYRTAADDVIDLSGDTGRIERHDGA